MDLHPALEALISVLLVGGAFFALVGSIGLSRLPDFFMRLHGPTKATTLGLGLMLAGMWLQEGLLDGLWSPRGLLISFFLFMTAPVSGHMLAKAGLHHRLGHKSGVPDAQADSDEAAEPAGD